MLLFGWSQDKQKLLVLKSFEALSFAQNAKIKKTKYCKSSRKVPKQKIIQVLLNSGSAGDLMFHKNGAHKGYPYLTRKVPKSWSTSNRISTQKEKVASRLIFLNIAILRLSTYSLKLLKPKKPRKNQFLTSLLVPKP